jgi:hypothetical protein
MHDDVDFVSLTKLDLERYCDEIAIAAVFLHYYPDAGSRHDFVHACTGTLCHQRWPADKIKRVMGAVLTIIQEEDDEMDDRMTAVVNISGPGRYASCRRTIIRRANRNGVR